LSAEWKRLFPARPPKTDFNDQIITLANVLMRQIDPTGKKPIIEPSAMADGYDPQPSVRSKHRPEHTE
jgi:hypothetical protein